MDEYRVLIGGCRDYTDYACFCQIVNELLNAIQGKQLVLLSGHCSGVDSMVERYAAEHNFNLEIYPAEWKKYGRRAGSVRNKQMVEKADCIIAFWDGMSKGTHNLIQYAKQYRKPVHIVQISAIKRSLGV